jgi:hypothetical protein
LKKKSQSGNLNVGKQQMKMSVQVEDWKKSFWGLGSSKSNLCGSVAGPIVVAIVSETLGQ